MTQSDSTSQGGPTNFLMKCSTSQEWKTIVSALQNLTEEAAFDVDSSGVRFRAMDPSHVAQIDLAWESRGFEKFECDANKKDRFVVRLEDFAKIIKRAEKNESITISRATASSSAAGGALIIRMGENREFEFHLLDTSAVSSGSTPLPKLSLVSKFAIGKAMFGSILDDISAVSSHIRIRAEPSKALTFSGKGDSGSARITLGEGDVSSFESPSESESVYSIEYIQKILKPAISSSGAIEFNFATKMPITASFSVGDSKEGPKMRFFLAPRTSD